MAIAQGRSNADIGAVLHLAMPTVTTHVSSILTELDLNSSSTAGTGTSEDARAPVTAERR